MCFNYESSIAALIVGLAGSIALFSLGSINDKILGAFFGYVSLMQGIYAILWKNQTCDYFHKNVTSLGMTLNLTQPLFLAVVVFIFNPKLKHGTSIAVISVIYLLCMAWFINDNYNQTYCTTPRKDDPHLVWNWTMFETRIRDWAVYLSTLCLISVLGLSSLTSGIIVALSFVIGATASFFIYPRQSIGSIWCFFSALVSPIVYGYRLLPKQYMALDIA